MSSRYNSHGYTLDDFVVSDNEEINYNGSLNEPEFNRETFRRELEKGSELGEKWMMRAFTLLMHAQGKQERILRTSIYKNKRGLDKIEPKRAEEIYKRIKEDTLSFEDFDEIKQIVLRHLKQLTSEDFSEAVSEDKDPIYEVEELGGRRWNDEFGRWERKVYWKGYPDEDATWEPECNVNNV